MPSRFPWSKPTPSQHPLREPALEPPRLSSTQYPPRQFAEGYYENYPPRDQSLSNLSPSTASSRASTPTVSRPDTGSPSPVVAVGTGAQHYEQTSPSSATSSRDSQIARKSLKNRLGLSVPSSSREDLQESLKESPKGLFGRRKSVRRKDTPSRSGQSPTEREAFGQWPIAEDPSIPPLPNEGRPFVPFGPDFTRDQIKEHTYSSGASPVTEAFSIHQPSPSIQVNSNAPSRGYQAYRTPLEPESQPRTSTQTLPALKTSIQQPPQPLQPRSGSRPSSRHSHDYSAHSPLRYHPYESQQVEENLIGDPLAGQMAPPGGPRQQRPGKSMDTAKISTPATTSRETSSLHPGPPGGSDSTGPSPISHSRQGPLASQDADFGRNTPPPPSRNSNDLSEADVNRLMKEYEQLRSKYDSVKRQYFNKKDQVETLQNTLAQQRLTQSRTSLDDGEYISRMSRLDGLVSQLAYGIRKDWKVLPEWLQSYVNKDAIQIGAREMTAVGRAVVSRWLVEQVFDKYFHPGLDAEFSAQLKLIQKTIWTLSPPCHSPEEEDALVAKVINWRLTTVDGLKLLLSGSEAETYRAHLTLLLVQQLVSELVRYLHDSAIAQLEGGVHMIIELAVGILGNLPLESRDVQIDFFQPGYPIIADLMKIETGIPPLNAGEANEADRASVQSSSPSEAKDTSTEGHEADGEPSKGSEQKKGFFGLGGRKPNSSPSRNPQKGLPKPPTPTVGGPREEAPPRVRMSVFLAVQIRGKMVLAKAPVYKI